MEIQTAVVRTIAREKIERPNAAIYRRCASDDPHSFDDQLKRCESKCSDLRWNVVRVYSDKNVSGLDTQRAGYQKMLADAVEGCFRVIVVDDLYRFSRDVGELGRFIRFMREHDVEIASLSDEAAISLSAIHREGGFTDIPAPVQKMINHTVKRAQALELEAPCTVFFLENDDKKNRKR